MSKEFLAPPAILKPDGHPQSPYMRARQEWDERIGAAVVQAKNWRLAFFFLALITALILLGLLYQLKQHRVVPVIVGLDKERGEPVVIGKASDVPYRPKLQEIKFFLSQFITCVRSVPTDPVLIKQNWLRAYQFLRRDAANVLNDITQKDIESPLKKIGLETVIAKPISVTQVGDGNSYQVRWEETRYDSSGIAVDRFIMNGVFTIQIDPPATEKTLLANPLGIYISHFQWSREL
jgi:type IV secretion system protein TrbF